MPDAHHFVEIRFRCERKKRSSLWCVGVCLAAAPLPRGQCCHPAPATSDENERFFRTAPIPDNTPTLNKRGQGRRDGTTPPPYEKERFFRSHRITKFHNGVRCTSWHGTRDKKSDAAQRTIIMRTVRKRMDTMSTMPAGMGHACLRAPARCNPSQAYLQLRGYFPPPAMDNQWSM